ncbi:MAG: thiamine diphosphokinase [Clostridia bacterium]|nr:thiamine diphosphokinase [Clostridia bacterium]
MAKRFSVPCSTVPRSIPRSTIDRRSARAAVIGAAPDPRGAELITDNDFVAVCDGGLNFALKRGIRFGMLVGDFDSYTGRLPDLPDSVELIRLPSEKDDTDTGFAVKTLLRRGFRDFLIIGGVGGRFDHTLGNIAVAADIAAHRGICELAGGAEGERIFVFRNRTIKLTPAKGAFVSIFPWGSASATVTASGFKYPLEHGKVSARTTLGVSNEFAPGSKRSVPAEITAESGTVVVVVNSHG